MSKIKILPEILSNKIAAGEVVERPASVVKELVENSLDAGSTRIRIEIEKGGRALIRVSDNGSGMSHDDALLALERYATSKIYKDQDLFSIRTLGFRGEALPSIASVSRFVLITRESASDVGTEIKVEGGKIKAVSEIGAPAGTMVSVKQLFYNTPARRKFLKSIGTEMSHIADIVSSTAMGRPDIQFKLIHNHKTIKNWSPTTSPFDRVIDVVGKDLETALHPIEFAVNGISISGWISSPRITRTTSRAMFVYVNNRFVRDRIIQHALFQGYSQRLVKGQFPIAIIFIRVPFDQVDINVHPTKNEVRFGHQQKVHGAVKEAVARTLHETDLPGWQPAEFSEHVKSANPQQISESAGKDFAIKRVDSGIQNKVFAAEAAVDNEANNISTQGVTRDSQPATRDPQTAIRRSQAHIWPQKRFRDLRPIGQFHNTYIVCESDEGLILLDQHAAHERILFEQLRSQSARARLAVQQLLVPETVELGFRETDALEKMIPELSAMGLGIEHFGGRTFVVKAVPASLSGRDVKPLIIEIAENMVTVGTSSDLKKALEQCCVLMACHGAIRANHPLSGPQIEGLLEQLDACDNPSHCPHGRPTWIRWDLKTLEKSFKRIL
jgi:DNA mismatch repair protein MutL